MCAMNLVKGSDSRESEFLMGLLREETDFAGFVVPDIGGQKAMNESANGGLDWASEQLWTPENFADLVTCGQVNDQRVDVMVIWNAIGLFRLLVCY